MTYRGKNKRRPILIEIKTNRKGWRVVELVAVKGNRMIIRLLSGETFSRKICRVHWCKVQRIGNASGSSTESKSWKKKFRTKKKRNKNRSTKGRRATSNKEVKSRGRKKKKEEVDSISYK